MTGLEMVLLGLVIGLMVVVAVMVKREREGDNIIENLESNNKHLRKQGEAVHKQLDRNMKEHHDFLEKQIGNLYARMGEETPTAALNSIPDRIFELSSILRKTHTKLIFKLRTRRRAIEFLKKENEVLLNSNEHLTKQLEKMTYLNINPPVTINAGGVNSLPKELNTKPSRCFSSDISDKALKEVEAFRTNIYAFKGKANIGRDIVSGTFQVKAINLDEAIAFLKGELSYELDLEFYVEGKELLLGGDIDVLSVDFNKSQLV